MPGAREMPCRCASASCVGLCVAPAHLRTHAPRKWLVLKPVGEEAAAKAWASAQADDVSEAFLAAQRQRPPAVRLLYMCMCMCMYVYTFTYL